MISNIIFRESELQEVDALLNVIHRCMREVNSRDYTEVEIVADIETMSRRRMEGLISSAHCYTGYLGKELIACGCVNQKDWPSPRTYLSCVFIKPEYHGHGYGKELLRRLEQDSWVLPGITLYVPASRTAHKFYVKQGYSYEKEPPDLTTATVLMFKHM